MSVAAALVALPLSLAATHASPAAAHRVCPAQAPRALIKRFVAAFDAGHFRRLDATVARGKTFRGYTVVGAPGDRVADARTRSTLLSYFRSRHEQAERLQLTHLTVGRRTRTTVSVVFEVVRSAHDLVPGVLYVGSATTTCRRAPKIVSWTMRPNSDPSVPTPAGYAQTCRLATVWCEVDPNGHPSPSPGGVPEALRRPLALPTVTTGGRCPITTMGEEIDNGQLAGFALGQGPVQPILLPFNRSSGEASFKHLGRGWYATKTLWFSRPDYHGPVFIRGRQLDGPHKLVMGGDGPGILVDPQLGPGDTLNGIGGWREWPGATWLRAPGCYAWQIDGTNFSHVVVFEAVFKPDATVP
jgi:hypothetical protein